MEPIGAGAGPSGPGTGAEPMGTDSRQPRVPIMATPFLWDRALVVLEQTPPVKISAALHTRAIGVAHHLAEGLRYRLSGSRARRPPRGSRQARACHPSRPALTPNPRER